MPEGTIVRLFSDWADVALDVPGGPPGHGEVVPARFRGRLDRLAEHERSPLAVGDRVSVALSGTEAIVESRHERKTKLSRAHPHDEHLEQVIAANVDRVLIVASPVLPPLRPALVDRYLVAAAAERLEAALCVTKCDLVDDEMLDLLLSHWNRSELRIFRTRRDRPETVELLRREWLEGKATVLVGQSGAGKTTLRNILLGATRGESATAEVGGRTGRGKHCTTAATFEPLEPSGFLVDTPGVKEFGVWKLEAADVKACFPEFARATCRFTDCRHVDEPGCGPKRQVEKGRASADRLISLVTIAASLPSKRYR